MSHQASTRVPVEDAYATLIGKAVYIFAYYEWNIICIIELIQKGFVGSYSRGNPMTSGAVKQKLQSVIDDLSDSFSKVSKTELQACCNEFGHLIVKRNALIHAHPCKDLDGSQMLTYQSMVRKPLSDMKWPKVELETVIQEFDRAACTAGNLLDKLR